MAKRDDLKDLRRKLGLPGDGAHPASSRSVPQGREDGAHPASSVQNSTIQLQASDLEPVEESLPEAATPAAEARPRTPLRGGATQPGLAASSRSVPQGREDRAPTAPAGKRGEPASSAASASSTIQLSVADLELVDLDQLIEQTSVDHVAPSAGAAGTAAGPAAGPLWTDWAADAAFYRREAQALGAQQPERAGLLWLEAARAAQQGGAERAVVLEDLRRAEGQAPGPQLAQLLRRFHLELGEHDHALALTARAAETGDDLPARVAALIEAHALLRQRGESEQAAALLRQARDLQAGHPIVLALLAGLYLEHAQHEPACDALEQLAEALGAPEERASCLLAAGSLCEHRLGQTVRAEQLYLRAVEHDPAHLPALVALAALHEQAGAWVYLGQTLERLVVLETEPAARARLLVRLGSLHLYRTRDLDAAARAFAAAAEVAPDQTTPLTRLAQIHEATGRRDAVLATLRRLLPLTVDPPGRAALLVRVGRLLRRVDQQEELIAVYRQALEAQPGYLPALQALGTLLRQRGDLAGLLEILRPESEGAQTTERRALCFLEMAELLATGLARPEEACAAYSRALELDPDLRLAFWRLRGLLREEQRFPELARLLATQIERTADPRSRQHWLLELARLQSGPIGAVDRAIATLERAREIKESSLAEMELLELHLRAGNHAEAAELLRLEARTTRDRPESLWRRIEAALLLEERLGEHDRALAVCGEVLAEEPGCGMALRVSGRILHRLGRWPELVALHQQQLAQTSGPAAAAALWCRIGRLQEEDLGRPELAIEAYQHALAQEPECGPALEALERLYEGAQRYAELVGVLQQLARTRRDPVAAADLLCRAAEVEDALRDDPRAAAALYGAALAESPGGLALERLCALQLRQGQHEAAAASLQRLTEQAASPLEASRLLLQRARLLDRLGRQPEPALLDEAAQAPGCEVRLRFEQLRARRLVAGGELAGALLYLGGRSPDPSLAAAYLLESALRAELSGLHQPQVEAAQGAASRAPEEPAASWCLQRGLRAAGEWDRLAAALESEAARQPDPRVRLQLLSAASAAEMLAGDAAQVGRLARQCLAIDGRHLPTLRWLAHLAELGHRWSDLAALQDLLAEACADAENRAAASMRAAELWADRVGDSAAAVFSLERLLARDPGQPQAFARAARLLDARGEHARLSELYAQRITACADPAGRAALLRLHVRLLRDRLGDGPRAAAELGRLLELCPEDRDALQELTEVLVAEERWSDAAAALARLIASAPDAATRQAGRLTLARLQLKQLRQPARAAEVIAAILEDDPLNLPARQLRVELLVEESRWADAQQLLDEVSAEDQPAVQVWALSQLADVARVGLRDEVLRSRYEDEALTLAAGHPEVLRDLVERARQRGELPRLVEAGGSVLERATDPAAAAGLRLCLAGVLLEDLRRPGRALELLRELRLAAPDQQEVALLHARALEQVGDLEGAAEAYRALVADDHACAPAYRGLSRILAPLGRPASALAATALLDLLGAATPSEKAHLEAREPRRAPAGRLDPAALPLSAELQPIARLLELARPHLGQVYPLKQRHPARATLPAVIAAQRLASTLGLTGVLVSIEGEAPARAGIGDPAPLQIAARVAARPESAVFRFWVGRALVSAARTGALLEQLEDDELARLVEALRVERPILPEVATLRRQVQRALPRKTRKQVEQLEVEVGRVTAARWTQLRQEERLRADQLGIVLCGNPRVGLAELAGVLGTPDGLAASPYVHALMDFVLSEGYAALHAALWSVHAP